MSDSRNVLTPEALLMMDVIARTGSFAAAARELGKVPSSLTYSVRQLEDALDVLLFDRRSRQARLTAAGTELLLEGRRLLEQMDAVANRVKRVATGWETQLTIAVDGVISRLTMFELCESFYALNPPSAVRREGASAAMPATLGNPGTRLRLRTEVLAGTWEALVTGQADLAIGVGLVGSVPSGVQVKELGTVGFVFAVADSAQRLTPVTVNLLPGQDVLTVGSMQLKIEALLRCMGCGFVPEPMVREHVAAGRLVVKTIQRAARMPALGYAWRTPTADAPGAARKPQLGLALKWWLAQLESPATRAALIERHGQVPRAGM